MRQKKVKLLESNLKNSRRIDSSISTFYFSSTVLSTPNGMVEPKPAWAKPHLVSSVESEM